MLSCLSWTRFASWRPWLSACIWGLLSLRTYAGHPALLISHRGQDSRRLQPDFSALVWLVKWNLWLPWNVRLLMSSLCHSLDYHKVCLDRAPRQQRVIIIVSVLYLPYINLVHKAKDHDFDFPFLSKKIPCIVFCVLIAASVLHETACWLKAADTLACMLCLAWGSSGMPGGEGQSQWFLILYD